MARHVNLLTDELAKKLDAPLLALCALLALPGTAFADCMSDAADQAALLECARNEVVPLERRVEQAYRRLLEKHKATPAMLEGLESSKKAWDAYRDAQCALEGEAHDGFDGERRVMMCVKNAFQRRLEDLDRL